MKHTKNIFTKGNAVTINSRVLIMLHGRGGSAEDILTLADELDVEGFSLLAPQATNNTWYPHSFLSPVNENEPWLSSAIEIIDETVGELLKKGIPSEHIYFAGFSQGACLTLEYTTRFARRYGGVVAFTGGLIGDKIERSRYKGDFAGTPVFTGTSNPDFHVPVERVYATTNIMTEMGAKVQEKVYNNMGHTIIRDEIERANIWVFKSEVSEKGITAREH